MENALAKSNCKTATTARDMPHPGHGNSNNVWKKQGIFNVQKNRFRTISVTCLIFFPCINLQIERCFDKILLENHLEKKMKKYFTPKNICIFLIAIIIIFLIYKCPFKFLFGISCPGCGMTRAFKSLLVLNFHQAFYYHPLFPLVIILAIGWFLEQIKRIKIKDSFKNIILFLSCILFIAVYILRLCYGSEIVYIDLKEGLFYKLYHIFIIN